MYSDEEDDLPKMPARRAMLMYPPRRVAQANQLHALEEKLEQLKSTWHDAAHRGSRRAESGERGRSSSDVDERVGASPSVSDQLEYDLRRAVPHLSATFSCSYQDLSLLLFAIHQGGGADGEKSTIQEQLRASESEKKALHSQLRRTTEERERWKDEAAEAKNRLQSAQTESRRATEVLALRREELRKQLIGAESRIEKEQHRSRKLELELNTLKEKLRNQLR